MGWPTMTLPDDYARCHGVTLRVLLKKPCVLCLRRTAPMRDQPYSYMTPPEFTTTCPERIAP
jgi:hypothetical protein